MFMLFCLLDSILNSTWFYLIIITYWQLDALIEFIEEIGRTIIGQSADWNTLRYLFRFSFLILSPTIAGGESRNMHSFIGNCKRTAIIHHNEMNAPFDDQIRITIIRPDQTPTHPNDMSNRNFSTWRLPNRERKYVPKPVPPNWE